MLIDLAGVVRKPERKDLEVCKVKYVTEVTLNYTAPELKTSLEKGCFLYKQIRRRIKRSELLFKILFV